MPVFSCKSCGSPLKGADSLAGKTVKCPHCQQPTRLESPQAETTAEQATAPAATAAPMATPVARSSSETAAAAEADAGFGGIQVDQETSPTRRISGGRKSKGSKLLPVLIGAGCLVVIAAVLVVVLVISKGSSRRLALKPIDDQSVEELQPLQIDLAIRDADQWDEAIQYELVAHPEGATLDEKSGSFQWTPTEEQGPRSYQIEVRAKAAESGTVSKALKFSIAVKEQNQPPVIEPVENQVVRAGEVLTVELKATDPDIPRRNLQYSIGEGAPANARIHAQSGILTWQPATGDAGQSHTISVAVTDGAADGASSSIDFQVEVTPAETALEKLVAKLQARNVPAEIKESRKDSLFPGQDCQVLEIDGEQMLVAQYDSFQEANGYAEKLQSNRDEMFGTTGKHGRLFLGSSLIALYSGDDATVLNHLDSTLGRPFLTVRDPSAAVVSNLPESNLPDLPVNPLETEQTGPFTKDETAALVSLYQEGQLFSPKNYADLRTLFAERFARLHTEDLKNAFGDDYDSMMAWLNENVELRDELFNAIDPESDNVLAALGLFKELKEKFPERILPYGNLAIAIAVTWDNPRAIYDYGGHQRRAKTTMPDDLAGPIENFEYFVAAERVMQGRAQWLPWEFLKLVVNNKTPLKEREWAVANYLPKRVMIGKCYSEVPYDHVMLDTKSEQAKLNGQIYNLPNILNYGGVCAHQADYAARVGQSLGVPAAYVGGANIYGGNHAWVMWVEVKAVSKTSIAFSLESHGRYRGDKYYVGTLKDPQTGKRITDRQLELRLHTVGLNATAKRQAELAMTAYPVLLEEESLDVAGQLDYLGNVVKLCPGNEEAWRAVAKMAGNETVREKHKKQMIGIVNQLFANFSNFPDFTWEVFDDLTQIEETLEKRIDMYNRLAQMYVAAKRPDLACEARLKLTDLYVENEQPAVAIDGLASTIYAFVDEGRYVPRMLDRLEALCQNVDGTTPALLAFYNSFLPRIPQMRGNRPSSYCIKMFERGISKFKEYGQPQVALAYEAQLAKIKAGQGQKK